jgi:hypothetical protein
MNLLYNVFLIQQAWAKNAQTGSVDPEKFPKEKAPKKVPNSSLSF